MAREKKLTIEHSMKRLDEIAELMSKEEITLETSFKLYHEGIGLVKECRNLLSGVEKQMRILEEEEKEESHG